MAWNTETEDYQMIRLVDKPHETALKIIGIEDAIYHQKCASPYQRGSCERRGKEKRSL